MTLQPDPHSARLVTAVASVMNLLECFDDTGIEVRGPAKKAADGILKTLGPAAVTCALLQAVPSLRSSPRTAAVVGLFAESCLRRREDLLGALPLPQRRAIVQRESQRSVSPARVIELFEEALAGISGGDLLRRWGSGGGVAVLSEQIDRIARGEEPEAEALAHLRPRGAGENEGSVESPQVSDLELPPTLLEGLGAVLEGVEATDGILERVLGDALPRAVPAGYAADATGTVTRSEAKVGRNEPCPCGSGKKFKRCCAR